MPAFRNENRVCSPSSHGRWDGLRDGRIRQFSKTRNDLFFSTHYSIFLPWFRTFTLHARDSPSQFEVEGRTASGGAAFTILFLCLSMLMPWVLCFVCSTELVLPLSLWAVFSIWNATFRIWLSWTASEAGIINSCGSGFTDNHIQCPSSRRKRSEAVMRVNCGHSNGLGRVTLSPVQDGPIRRSHIRTRKNAGPVSTRKILHAVSQVIILGSHNNQLVNGMLHQSRTKEGKFANADGGGN